MIRKYPAILSGMLFYSALFVVSLAWNAGISAMGISQAEVTTLVMTKFLPFVILSQLKIFMVYLLAGFLTGVYCEFTTRHIPVKFKGEKYVLLAVLFLTLLLSSMQKYPQLYAEPFFDKGESLKAFQLFVTDSIPVLVLSFLKIFLVLAGFAAFVFWILNDIKKRTYIAAAGVLFCAGVLAADHLYTSVNMNRGPNIIILAADSLRYDTAMDKGICPNINSIAAEGVSFHKQFSSLPRTFPAMMSLLTGNYPVTHGIRHMFPSKWQRDFKDTSFVEKLRKEGYRTAVVADFAGDVFSRVYAGFEKIKAPYFNFVTLIDQRALEMHFMLFPYITNSAGRKLFPELKEFANNADPFLLNREIRSTLASFKKDEKFCLLVFYSTTHFPYAAPDPYYKKYALPGYRGRYKYHKPPTIYSKEKMSDTDIAQIRAVFNGAASCLDDAIGEITGYLKKNGMWDDSIVLVTADHGESLYENGWTTGHGEHLRGPNVINIPLVMKLPRGERKGASIRAVTREIDVMPTIFDFLGIDHDKNIDGVSLLPLIKGEKEDLGLSAFSETGIWFSSVTDGFYQKQRIMYPDITRISQVDYTYNMEVVIKPYYEQLINIAKHRMVDDGKFRLIYIPTRQGIFYELYKDEDYTQDVIKDYPDEAARLKKVLFNIMSKDNNSVLKQNYMMPVE